MVQQVTDGLIPQGVLDEMLTVAKPEAELPDWYPVIRAAKYLGVPPWDLVGLPGTAGCQVWVRWAWAAERGEAEAQAELQRRAERKRG